MSQSRAAAHATVFPPDAAARPPLSGGGRAGRPRWHLVGRSLVLPLAAAALVAVLPWRAADLLAQWRSIAVISPASAQSLPAAPTSVPAPTSASAPTSAPASTSAPAAPQPSVVPAPNLGLGASGDVGADAKLLAEVARRNAELDQRARELDTRGAEVAAAAKLARAQLDQLAQLRQQVETLVAQQHNSAEGDLTLLIGLYSNMKPQQAAAVLGKLDAPKAAAILQGLDIRSAGPILADMDPAAALAITEELEQRRAAFRQN